MGLQGPGGGGLLQKASESKRAIDASSIMRFLCHVDIEISGPKFEGPFLHFRASLSHWYIKVRDVILNSSSLLRSRFSEITYQQTGVGRLFKRQVPVEEDGRFNETSHHTPKAGTRALGICF